MPNTDRPQLPTATSMLLWFWLSPLLNGLAVIGYFKLAEGEMTHPVVLLPMYMACALAIPLIPFGYLAYRVSRVRARLQTALDEGVPKLELPRDDVVFMLRMHRWFIPAQILLWAFFSLGWPLFLEVVTDDGAVLGDFLDTLVGLCMGVTSGVTAFYKFELLSRHRIAPLLLAETLDHLRPFPPFRIWQHIWLLVFTLGGVQPLAIFVLHARSGGSLYADLFLVAYFLGVGTFQAVGIQHALSFPAGHLDEKMAQVRDGDLSTRARVDSLDTFGRLASAFNVMVEGLEQRERMRELFGRYVTTQVAEEILEGRVQLGGERRHATVLFSDIRGFTAMSEHLSPEDVVAFLNRYFEEMIDCVLEHGGTIDKFIGDAVMAVFGVPTSLGPEIDAKCAASCALDMVDRLEKLNRERQEHGEPAIDIGIALHSGELVAGAIGSSKRMEYTVIGDTVNLTSRLEGLTKRLGRRVVLSSDTAGLIKDSYTVEPLEELPVRGRTEPVEVLALNARLHSSTSRASE